MTPEDAIEKIRLELVAEFNRIRKERKWSQAHIAQMLNISQPTVSHLCLGKTKSFALIFKILRLLNYDVVISVAERPKARSESKFTTSENNA